MPPGVPPPPAPLPRPDLREAPSEGATYGAKKAPRGKGRKKKGSDRTVSRHPTDAYEPLRKHRRFGVWFAVVLAVLVLFALATVALLAYAGPGRCLREGYKLVRLEAEDATVAEAPGEATIYLGRGRISYTAPRTRVPVAFLAREVALEGDFYEDVSITAAKVPLPSAARFAKDLEIFALEFRDGGIVLKGELKGRVASSRSAR
jgi:hypothetical protein